MVDISKEAVPAAGRPSGEAPVRALASELFERAWAEGMILVGLGGLLAELTKSVLEAGLEAEMTEHLGYELHDPTGAVPATPATAPGPRPC